MSCGAIATEYISIVPAHQRQLGACGVGMKPPDTYALPLCSSCHNDEHQVGHATFWMDKDIALMCLELLTEYLAEGGKC